MDPGITEHDHRRRRCPTLGHDLEFRYCRAPGRDLPCGRIVGCWSEAFDVESWLREHFTAEQIAAIHAPRKDKACTLVELIARARDRATEAGSRPEPRRDDT